MRLENKNISMNKIMLDPLNPRFVGTTKSLSQEQLVENIVNSPDGRELSKSMENGIMFINNIVIRHICEILDKETIKLNNLQEYEYIVVEGNTRLSCLKRKLFHPYENECSEIPVLIAIREENESIEKYKMELKKIQALANVMKVKDWDEIAKTNHIYEIYLSMLELEKRNFSDIVQIIAAQLGMSTAKIKNYIIRYTFYEKINEFSNHIDDNELGYLEAFETRKVRNLFGMSLDEPSFDWIRNELNEELYIKKELFLKIPLLIKNAKNLGENAKIFRNKIRKLANECINVKQFNSAINDLLSNNGYEDKDNKKNSSSTSSRKKSSSTSNRNKSTKKDSNKGDFNNNSYEISKWKKEFERIYKKIDSFPSTSDWAIELYPDIEKIYDKILKHKKNMNL